MTQLQQNNGFLPVSRPTITKKEIEYVTAAIASGWVSSLGEYITAFEEKFAEFCGSKYALTCSNGTTSLHLALVSMGVEAGDEVIMPDLTFIATANATKYVGAVPVLVVLLLRRRLRQKPRRSFRCTCMGIRRICQPLWRLLRNTVCW